MPSFYITTPIYYINAEPHLGHAYTSMVADAIARSRRLLDQDVFFLTGTDEHGMKMVQTAKKEGLTARALADRNAAEFQRMATALNASNYFKPVTGEKPPNVSCRNVAPNVNREYRSERLSGRSARRS